ncbi:hypothetical protein RND71_040148 [Anisodus tanguticus]|uniref:Uncharacterized protein n=1 Tax=Anisodus tanguticus TaxID=243964 RepID=A0AAE1USM3_9SOLA|nr:hypothetical protein RND71_040148 [Anisodus tanguticus]
MSGLINIWTTEFAKLQNNRASESQGNWSFQSVVGKFESLKKLTSLQNYYSEASISMILDCVSP